MNDAGDDTLPMPGALPRPATEPTREGNAPDYPTLTLVDPAHYVMLHEIARGGMGRIRIARDRRLGREVAIKEVLDEGGSVPPRFEREARVTARLQHPSIISVHEAGLWPSREPFYAMPFVAGRSLDEVIAAATTPAERLALVPNILAVADAMAYAHGQRVIHRDLKPRNIVVGEFGETVVIDWGIAKDLAESDATGSDLADSLDLARAVTATAGLASSSAGGETTLGEVLGTPAYMPPEQAHGQMVDERADVYAIGAILYHVLAGRAPYIAGSNMELLSAVFEGPPTPVRELVPDLPSELAAIVERAMARTAADRYPTARALAEDLRRFQTGQLVGAHRYSLPQLLQRWLRRHRTALVATAAALAVAIAVGVVAIQRIVVAQRDAEEQRAEAQAQRAVAEARQKDSEGLMQFMLVDLRDRLQAAGKLDLLDTVARRASAYYDAHATGTGREVELAAIARGGVGEVLAARGKLADAAVELQSATALVDKLAASHPEVTTYEETALDLGRRRAGVKILQGDFPEAEAAYRALLVRAQRLFDRPAPSPLATHLVFMLRADLGDALITQGELEEALVEYRAALPVAEKRAAMDDSLTGAKDLLLVHAKLGRLLLDAEHDPAGALVEYRTGLAIGEKLNARDPKDPRWLSDIGTSHDEIGTVLREQHKFPQALVEFQAGIGFAQRAAAVDPSNVDMQESVAVLREKVGTALFDEKLYARALAEFTAAREIWSTQAVRDPTNLQALRGESVTDNKIGDVHLVLEQYADAIASYKAGLALRERMVAEDPTRAEWRRDLFYSHYELATTYEAIADRPHHVEELRAALEVADVTLAAHPSNETFASDSAASPRPAEPTRCRPTSGTRPPSDTDTASPSPSPSERHFQSPFAGSGESAGTEPSSRRTWWSCSTGMNN